jgi:hypothetical protein
MFNIFETEGETVQEQAKVSMLLKKVEHPQLQAAVGTLRIRAQMDNVFFTECANPIFARVSELPDYQLNRKILAADTGVKVKPKRIRGGGGSGALPASKRNGIHMPDGSVWTGYYSNWEKMPDADKQTVMNTRKRNKVKGMTPTKRKVSNVKAQLAELKRSIAAIELSNASKGDDTSVTDDSSVLGNAVITSSSFYDHSTQRCTGQSKSKV